MKPTPASINRAKAVASKAIRLSVHRNTIEARRKRVLARDATKQIEAIIRENDVRAYAFVAIGSDGAMYSCWDTGSILPKWAFPSTMAAGLQREMEDADVAETWQPPLPLKG